LSKILIIRLAPLIIGLTIAFLLSITVSIYLRLRSIRQRLDETKFPDNIELRRYIAQRALRELRVLNIANIITFVTSVIAAVLVAILYFKGTNGPSIRQGTSREIFAPLPVAYLPEQAGITAPVQPFLGYMLSAILLVMLAVFMFAVIAVLLLKDIPQNTGRRTAANDIVKTFGGFFIGILTSFLKQAIGT
jgi:hypothetical protein